MPRSKQITGISIDNQQRFMRLINDQNRCRIKIFPIMMRLVHLVCPVASEALSTDKQGGFDPSALNAFLS